MFFAEETSNCTCEDSLPGLIWLVVPHLGNAVEHINALNCKKKLVKSYGPFAWQQAQICNTECGSRLTSRIKKKKKRTICPVKPAKARHTTLYRITYCKLYSAQFGWTSPTLHGNALHFQLDKIQDKTVKQNNFWFSHQDFVRITPEFLGYLNAIS